MLGGLIGGAISGIGSIATSAMNMREAEKNRDWQKMMSDTAHQREVKDLRAAGLNPILSAGGSGASTGSGAQASMSDLGGALTSGISQGQQVATARQQTKQAKMNTSVQSKKFSLYNDPVTGHATTALALGKDMGLSDRSAMKFMATKEAERLASTDTAKELYEKHKKKPEPTRKKKKGPKKPKYTNWINPSTGESGAY